MKFFDGIRRALRLPPERPQDIEREVDDEFAFHIAMRESSLRSKGLDARTAAVEARRRFGDAEEARQACLDEDLPAFRAARFHDRLEDIARDIRIAARSLRRSPAFALAAATLVALGIGGTTSVFSIVNAIYFRPLPYPKADRIALLQASFADPLCDRRCARSATSAEIAVWRKSARSIENIGTIELRQGPVATSSGSMVLEGAAIDHELPTILGLHAAVGRMLVPADFTDGAAPALVLSYSAWLAKFGGDSSVVGQLATIGDVSYRIVGVLATESELGPPIYSFNVRTAEYILPQTRWPASLHQVIGILRPGANVAEAEGELTRLLREGNGAPWQASVRPLRDALAERYRGSFTMLFAASLVVLLLTCMNVGGLLVARLNDRIPELATRAVLGATRFQLVQQVVVETGLLALAGGIGGVAIALYGTSAARLIPLERLPFWTPIVMDSRVLVLAAVLALVGGLALSIAPLVTLSPPRIASELRALVVGAPTRARGRRIVVGLEVAFSVVLFGISGILIKQLVSAERIDLGSAKRSVVFVALANRGPAKDGGWPDRMIQGLYVLPRVHAVAISGLAKRMTATRERRDSVMRAPSALRRAAVYVEGRPDPIPDLLFRIATIVTRDFFTATGIRLVAGRPFAATDDARAPGVIVINETAARKAFGDASAIGKRIRIESGGTLGEWLTIVGVVPDQRQPFSTHPARLEELYRPWGQVDAEPANVAVRVEGDSREIAPLLPKAMHAVDPSVAIASVDPVEVWFDRVMWAARFTTDVLTTFALFALVLACLGVYATVSYVVGRRRREMAIRVAMGATQRDVISSVLRSSITMLLSGLGAGVVGAIIVARLARSMLFGSDGLDIIALGTAVVAIFTAGVIAAYLPARRAAVADPLVSLRAD